VSATEENIVNWSPY